MSAIEARKYFLSFSMTSPVCSGDLSLVTLGLLTGDPEATGDVRSVSSEATKPGLWKARSKSTWNGISGKC